MNGEAVGGLLFVGYFVLVPALTYLAREREHRSSWRRRLEVELAEPTPGGPFRDEGVAMPPRTYVAEVHGAPRHVKVVIVTSLVLGHMFLPGLFAGLFGLPIYGVGLVSIPGLWLAASIYRNAFGLLRCEPAAADQARRLRSFAINLNVVVLGAVALLALFEAPYPILLFTAAYAGISLAHAEGLGRAADAIEAVHRGETERVTEDELMHAVASGRPDAAAPSSVVRGPW